MFFISYYVGGEGEGESKECGSGKRRREILMCRWEWRVWEEGRKGEAVITV